MGKGRMRAVSGERKAEIKEQTLKIFAVIFRVRVPITVDFFIFLLIYFGRIGVYNRGI
jgi:hypothetical protein